MISGYMQLFESILFLLSGPSQALIKTRRKRKRKRKRKGKGKRTRNKFESLQLNTLIKFAH